MASMPSSPAFLASPLAAGARRPRTGPLCRRRRPLRPVSAASGGGGGPAGSWEQPSGRRSQVDEGMVVLRRRIREMEEDEVPEHWAEWEKRYYRGYQADVCEAVGLLQNLLMRTRPGVAIGVAALVALSVPTSAGVVVVHLVGAVKNIFF